MAGGKTMNDKQKQIEEMAWIIQTDCNNGSNCNCCEFRDNNFKKIYDKRLECENISRAIKIYDILIPKGSVVLTKEEHIEILGKIKMLEQLRKAITKIAKEFGVEVE